MSEHDAHDTHDPDRRWPPNVITWRLGMVEKQGERNEQEIQRLAGLVSEFVSAMPHKYVLREEHTKLVDQLSELASDLRTFTSTMNASNAMREQNLMLERERDLLQLQLQDTKDQLQQSRDTLRDRDDEEEERARRWWDLRLAWPAWAFAGLMVLFNLIALFK